MSESVSEQQLIQSIPPHYRKIFADIIQQKDTDDFGGEMTASEFKKELLEKIKRASS